MTRRGVYAIVAIAGIAALATAVLLAAQDPTNPGEDVLAILARALPILLCGLFLWWHRPDLVTARQLLTYGTVTAFAMALEAGIDLAAFHSENQSWTWWPLTLSYVLTVTTSVLLAYVLGLLPDGVYRTNTERRVLRPLWLLTLAPLLMLVANRTLFVADWSFDNVAAVSSPVYISQLSGLGGPATALTLFGQGAFLVGVVLLIARFQKAEKDLRARLRLVLLAGVATVVSAVLLIYIIEVPDALTTLIWLPVYALIPVSIVVAILHRRLFDVDVVVRKSGVYAALWLAIAAIYVTVSATFGVVAGSRLPLEIAIVLAVVAAMAFHPLRRLLERIADQWVFGERPSPYEAVVEFGTSVDKFDPDDVARGLANTLQHGLRLEWASVTIEGEPPALAGQPHGDPAFKAPIAHGSTEWGSIECGPRVDGAISDADKEMVSALASQAGLAVHSARLASRVVHAEESARRTIQRDIHDSAQQELIAHVANLNLARRQFSQGTLTDAELQDLQEEGLRILDDLRDLARGIHPSVLSDVGLVEAVRELSARLPIDVAVETSTELDRGRFPDEIEGAAYFVISEGLTNVLKHSGAESARVDIHADNSWLDLRVSDDGRGFTRRGQGTGLNGLEDRLHALGGDLSVESQPDGGTVVHARLPTKVRM